MKVKHKFISLLGLENVGLYVFTSAARQSINHPFSPGKQNVHVDPNNLPKPSIDTLLMFLFGMLHIYIYVI